MGIAKQGLRPSAGTDAAGTSAATSATTCTLAPRAATCHHQVARQLLEKMEHRLQLLVQHLHHGMILQLWQNRWRCLLKTLVFSVLIQFMQKEVHYLRVLGWFSKNEGGAISPGSGAIFKEWRRCNISWFWGGRKKRNKRTHVLSWGVGVPTWFSIVRAAICMGWPAWRQLQCPYAKGSATELAEKQRTAVINISWFWGDFQRMKEAQYLLVLWWFSQNEGLVVRRQYKSNKEGSTQLTKPHWVSQCLQHQMLLMLWYHHLQHQMLLMVYELHQHQKRRLQLSLQEPFRQ